MKDNSIKCDKTLTFEECELAILRMQVDKAQEKMGERIVSSEEIRKMISIVEDFIKRKNLICYGGTAINNILPETDQFYNKSYELADYDFFTTNGVKDAIELSDIYLKNGYTEVEAKSAQHEGTYKVFVNYIPIADITTIPKEIFNSLKKESIQVANILYAPPNFLRMSMYLELSRPAGDTDRWEKVAKRLTLLNKNYPITDIKCEDVNIQRSMEDTKDVKTNTLIYNNIRNTLINQGVVFFGGYAISLYGRYMPKHLQKKVKESADFDVISHNPESTAKIVVERLKDIQITNTQIIYHKPIGEIVPEHYEIKIGKDTTVFIFKPIACHSYNTIKMNGQILKVATIDTMLSFYLAFLYTDRPYFNNFTDRILCMSKFLYDVQKENRLAQKGLLKRFSITCYGHQQSKEELRSEKANKFNELRHKRNTQEYNKYFFSYKPNNKKNVAKKQTTKKQTTKKQTTKKQTTKKQTTKKQTTKKQTLFSIF